jgi:TPR repeat protein
MFKIVLAAIAIAISVPAAAAPESALQKAEKQLDAAKPDAALETLRAMDENAQQRHELMARAYWYLMQTKGPDADPPHPAALRAAHGFVAADLGSAVGAFIVGHSYQYGSGVPQDPSRAIFWYEKAVKDGHARAMHHLGMLLASGKGDVNKDTERALELYLRAGENGRVEGFTDAAEMYVDGNGVMRDYDRGLELYRRAADSGSTRAMTALAEAHREGRVASKDPVMAYAWHATARRAYREDAKEAPDFLSGILIELAKRQKGPMDKLETKMSHEQIVEAQREARSLWAEIKNNMNE